MQYLQQRTISQIRFIPVGYIFLSYLWIQHMHFIFVIRNSILKHWSNKTMLLCVNDTHTNTHRVFTGLHIIHNCRVCLEGQNLLLFTEINSHWSLSYMIATAKFMISPSGWQQKHWCSALPAISAFIWTCTAKNHVLLDCLLQHYKRWETICSGCFYACLTSKFLSIAANNSAHWLCAPSPPSFCKRKSRLHYFC